MLKKDERIAAVEEVSGPRRIQQLETELMAERSTTARQAQELSDVDAVLQVWAFQAVVLSVRYLLRSYSTMVFSSPNV